ncbi:MAG: hypothetical protein EXS05_12545 [Planctomycetaceae bacterium]|nr:hypothetical protein [Planctomycetaceae bacterium]
MNEDAFPDDDANDSARQPAPPAPPPVETDDRFPSGPWEGFFLQPMLARKKGWMELGLTFRNGSITGEGRDWVGRFLVRGRYELDSGKCWWTKRYIGKHDVSYNGYNEGKGIWGQWEMVSRPWRGGFYIWPVGMGDPSQQRLAEAVDLPIEQEIESPALPAGQPASTMSPRPLMG